MKSNEEKFSYDKAIAQVEAIVGQLETRGGTGFDEMIANVERALRLIDECKRSIADAEAKLARLTKEETQENQPDKE